jgi:hypothetical protein
MRFNIENSETSNWNQTTHADAVISQITYDPTITFEDLLLVRTIIE